MLTHPDWTDLTNTRQILRLIIKSFLFKTYHLETLVLVDYLANMRICRLFARRKAYIQGVIIRP